MNEIAQGTASLAPLDNGRPYTIYAKDFTSTDQAVPITLPFGRPKRFAGIMITPVWSFRSQALTSEQGK